MSYADEAVFKLAKNGSSADMAVDGSSTPVHFDVVAHTNDEKYVHRCCVLIVDGGQRPTRFGGLSELTNGLLVKVVDADGDDVIDFLDGEAIKKNADWVLLAGVDNPITAASGDDQVSIRWTISKAFGGSPLRLQAGQKLRFTVQDDLTGLTSFRIMAQGLT